MSLVNNPNLTKTKLKLKTVVRSGIDGIVLYEKHEIMSHQCGVAFDYPAMRHTTRHFLTHSL